MQRGEGNGVAEDSWNAHIGYLEDEVKKIDERADKLEAAIPDLENEQKKHALRELVKHLRAEASEHRKYLAHGHFCFTLHQLPRSPVVGREYRWCPRTPFLDSFREADHWPGNIGTRRDWRYSDRQEIFDLHLLTKCPSRS